MKKQRHLYFTNRKQYWRNKAILQAQFLEEPEQEEKTKYRRQSYILTAYYDGEMFFDWRVSILNSKKTDTKDYLKKVLTNRWEKWATGKRSTIWSFVIEAYEDEFIDESEAKRFNKENVVIWEKR